MPNVLLNSFYDGFWECYICFLYILGEFMSLLQQKMHHRSWLASMPEFFKWPMLMFDWHKFEKEKKKINSDASFVPRNSDNKNCCIICRFLHHVKGGIREFFLVVLAHEYVGIGLRCVWH